MKYCNNCQAYRESWADKGYFGENYANKCWYCAKCSLISNPTIIGDPPTNESKYECRIEVNEKGHAVISLREKPKGSP
jgi:hypothetical protein